MTTGWVIQFINVATVAAFGLFLMWRTRESVRRRMEALPPTPPISADAADRQEKQRRLMALKAEVSQLERELGTMHGSTPVATGAP